MASSASASLLETEEADPESETESSSLLSASLLLGSLRVGGDRARRCGSDCLWPEPLSECLGRYIPEIRLCLCLYSAPSLWDEESFS